MACSIITELLGSGNEVMRDGNRLREVRRLTEQTGSSSGGLHVALSILIGLRSTFSKVQTERGEAYDSVGYMK